MRLLGIVLSINSGSYRFRETWVALWFETRVSWICHEVKLKLQGPFPHLHHFPRPSTNFILVVFNSSLIRAPQSDELKTQ